MTGRIDAVLAGGVRTVAVATTLLVPLIGLFLLREAWPALTTAGPSAFFLDGDWRPSAAGTQARFGIWPMLLGSIYAATGAILLAAPLGVLLALYLRVYAAATTAALLRPLVQLLAGVPSVVYGFWGLVAWVPLIALWQPPGASLLAAILILTLMVLPTVTLLTDTALAAVPTAPLRAAAATGLSRATMVWRVLLPAARGGIATGVVLATGRALGETMAVLMVAGNVVNVPDSLFDPVRVLTANIALEMAYALDVHRAALFATGLVLLALATALALAAAHIERAQDRSWGRADG